MLHSCSADLIMHQGVSHTPPPQLSHNTPRLQGEMRARGEGEGGGKGKGEEKGSEGTPKG